MATLVVRGDRLVLRLSRSEHLMGLAMRDPEAPLAAVRSAHVVRPARKAIRGIRAPGTGFPGAVWVGHWRGRGFHDFVAVYDDHGGVAVQLAAQPYDRFVVSVDDPESVVAEIEKGRGAAKQAGAPGP